MPIGIQKHSKEFVVPYLPPKEVFKPKAEVRAEEMKNYLGAMPTHSEANVTLVSSIIHSDELKRMRVRGTNPGKDKARTDVDMLARGTQHYADGVMTNITKNDAFGKYGERWFNDRHITTTLPELHTAILDKDTLFGAIKRAKLNIDTCTLSRMYATRSSNGKMWEYTDCIKPVRSTHRLFSRALVDNNVLACTNSLLRQILLFKGIGQAEVQQALQDNNMKPVTFVVNTNVEYDQFNQKDPRFTRIIHVHKITVKKVFNTNGKYTMFFDSRSCKAVTLWIWSFTNDVFND